MSSPRNDRPVAAAPSEPPEMASDLRFWSPRSDSNRRPSDYEATANRKGRVDWVRQRSSDKVCGKLEQACASQNIGQGIGHSSGPAVTTRAADRLARRARTPRASDRNRMLIVRPAAIGERRGESSPSTKSFPGNVLTPESHSLWLHSGILAADACPGGVDAHAIQPRGGWC
jgi:hypothetical protein